MPMQSREEIDARLTHLAQPMSEIVALDDSAQIDAFDPIAEGIRADTQGTDREHVWSRLQCLLRDSGLIPGDDEPCNG